MWHLPEVALSGLVLGDGEAGHEPGKESKDEALYNGTPARCCTKQLKAGVKNTPEFDPLVRADSS